MQRMSTATSMPNDAIAQQVTELSDAPYRAIPKIVVDILLWFSGGYLIYISSNWIAILTLAFLIGAVPLHDLLVQGHEGSHGLISRVRWINELLGWLTLAPVLISCAAHRAFHMRHHESPHGEGDPEYEFFNRVVPGVPGWAFLLIPAGAPVAVNFYALRHISSRKFRLRIVAEIVGGIGLHLLLAILMGWQLYLKAVVLPMMTGLPFVSVLRSICEHHATPRGDEWKTARSVRTNKVLEWMWSNVNYHLEHHLYPGVPYHNLPAVKQLLESSYAEKNASIGQGYLRTTASLIREPNHFSGT